MLKNSMRVEFSAVSDNERFARGVAAAFVIGLDPTMDELSEIKTAISEAVTNAIIHGYSKTDNGKIIMEGGIYDDVVEFSVTDRGMGISDIKQAMEPLYTGHPEEDRSGMGFTIMETFMDNVDVESEVGRGTCVTMRKRIGRVTE